MTDGKIRRKIGYDFIYKPFQRIRKTNRTFSDAHSLFPGRRVQYCRTRDSVTDEYGIST